VGDAHNMEMWRNGSVNASKTFGQGSIPCISAPGTNGICQFYNVWEFVLLITETWRKSTKSGPYSDNCAEVRKVGNQIQIRNSKNPDAGTALFTEDEWIAFIGGVKDNEFEL
jgi:hypothetical protein